VVPVTWQCPIAEPSMVASSQAPPQRERFGVPAGHPRVVWWRRSDYLRLATPFVALSGVHVSHVRVRPVGAVVGSWSELVGGSPLLSAGERPAADGRARLGGDHETGWAPCRLAQESAVGRLVWAAAHAWKGRDAPWFPQAG
jgi:hypothetical protein